MQMGLQHMTRRIHFLVRRYPLPGRWKGWPCLVICLCLSPRPEELPVRLTFDFEFPAHLRIRPILERRATFATFCTSTWDWSDTARHTGRWLSPSLPERVKIDLATTATQLTSAVLISSSNFWLWMMRNMCGIIPVVFLLRLLPCVPHEYNNLIWKDVLAKWFLKTNKNKCILLSLSVLPSSN